MPPHEGLRRVYGTADSPPTGRGLAGATASRYPLARRIRLVAYGARLESVLG
jgi:hypothetical protein